jgi:hypothetical protein
MGNKNRDFNLDTDTQKCKEKTQLICLSVNNEINHAERIGTDFFAFLDFNFNDFDSIARFGSP